MCNAQTPNTAEYTTLIPAMNTDKFLVFKVTYNSITRKIPVTNEDLTFDDFALMMERVLDIPHGTFEKLQVTYMDEDKDWITMSSSEELSFALSTCGSLNITLQPKISSTMEPQCLKILENELTKLRSSIDSCISNISKLSLSSKESKVAEPVKPADLMPGFSQGLPFEPHLKSDASNQRENQPRLSESPKYTPQPVRSGQIRPIYTDAATQSSGLTPPAPPQQYDPNRARPQMGYDGSAPLPRFPQRPDIGSGPSQISTMDRQMPLRVDPNFSRDQGADKPHLQSQALPPPYGSQIPPRPSQMPNQPSQPYYPQMRPHYPYMPASQGQYPSPPSSQMQQPPRQGPPPMYGYSSIPRTSDGPIMPPGSHQ